MQLPAEYEAPEHLMEHCFVRETAKAKLQELRQINADLAAAMTPISNTKKQQKTDVKLQNNKGMGNRHHDDEDSLENTAIVEIMS